MMEKLTRIPGCYLWYARQDEGDGITLSDNASDKYPIQIDPDEFVKLAKVLLELADDVLG